MLAQDMNLNDVLDNYIKKTEDDDEQFDLLE